MWKENLLNNLLVLIILLSILAITYCKVKNITMVEMFKEIREIINPSEVLESTAY